jgi:hypothetical protein
MQDWHVAMPLMYRIIRHARPIIDQHTGAPPDKKLWKELIRRIEADRP